MKVNIDRGHADISSSRLPKLGSEGSLDFGSLQVPVNYWFNKPTDDTLRRDRPAEFMVCSDGLSVMALLHKSVPKKFREAVLFHELVEAELSVQLGCAEEVAHRIAKHADLDYAKRNLSDSDFHQYLEWRGSLPDRSRPLEEILRG